MTRIIKITLLIISFSFFCKCSNKEIHPQKTQEEINKLNQDSLLKIAALNARTNLILNTFHDTIPSDIDTNYYFLILHGAFDIGNSVKFVNKGNRYFLYVKTLNPQDSVSRLTQYVTEIDKSEWDELEYMINEFNFWTAKQFKNNSALDGYVYFLEGSRNTNNGKLHQLIGRANPRYDKIGALCDYIMQFQEQLVYQYKQVHK